MTDNAAVLAELVRVKALFQLRAIDAVIRGPVSGQSQQDSPSNGDANQLRCVLPAGVVNQLHTSGDSQ